MGRKERHFTNSLEVIAPLPLLCFSIYCIFATSDGLWIRSVGSTSLIVSILVSLITVISLFFVIIALLQSNQAQMDSFNLFYIVSLFFTGCAVLLSSFYSSYKKELQATYLTEEYIKSTNGSQYEIMFNQNYNNGLKKMGYYHNRTLLIHDLMFLLYALEILIVFIAKTFAGQIISFFSNDEEELDIEKAATSQEQNPLLIPEVEDNKDKEEDNNKQHNDTNDVDEKIKNTPNEEPGKEDVVNNKQNDEPKKKEEEKPVEVNQKEDNKEDNDQDRNNLQKIEKTGDKKTSDDPKKEKESIEPKKEKDIRHVTRKDSEEEIREKPIDKKTEKDEDDNKIGKKDDKKKQAKNKTKTPERKKGLFMFDDLSESSSDDITPDIFSRTTTNNSPKTRSNRKHNTSIDSDDFNVHASTSARRAPPPQRRTRRINERRDSSGFGFSKVNDSDKNSLDELLDDDFAKTSPTKKSIQYTPPRRERKSPRKVEKSPFGFDMDDSSNIDDLLNDL